MGHILLVDDHVFLLRALSILLSKEGYTFELANNGEEALALFNAQVFDVVVTDIDMPVMNGYELIQNIRKSENDSTPIVVLSSLLKHNNDQSLGEIGATAYLSKTDSPIGILGVLKDILAKAS